MGIYIVKIVNEKCQPYIYLLFWHLIRFGFDK